MTTWAADTSPSLPEPVDGRVNRIVLEEGFAFSPTGIVHDMTEADWEAHVVPSFSPNGIVPSRGGSGGT